MQLVKRSDTLFVAPIEDNCSFSQNWLTSRRNQPEYDTDMEQCSFNGTIVIPGVKMGNKIANRSS